MLSNAFISGFFGSIGVHEHLRPSDEQIAQARALVHQPQALILDEPTSGLDMGASLGLLTLLRQYCGAGRAMLITTHHIDEIIPEIERVVLLDQGRVVADGPKAEVLTDTNLSTLYQTGLRVSEQNGWYRCWHD